MTKTTYSYRRLLPRDRAIFSYAELWAEEDHLLSATSNRLSVQYQRFPLAEIQAISVTALPHWTWGQISWLVASGLLFAVLTFSPSVAWARVLVGAFTVWPFALAIRELWKGPRCRTLIHTATGAHDLPAVRRQQHVAGFLAVVTPLIEGVQGRVESLEVTERFVAHPEETAREQLRSDRILRFFAFGTLLAEGLFSILQWRWADFARKPEAIMLGLGFFVVVVAVMLTVWRRSSPLLRKDRVYLLVGAALALAFAEFAIVTLWTAVASFRGTPAPELWADAAAAAWRIPLALVALALELTRQPLRRE